MSTCLRVLTYNVQLRSWAMEAGAQGSLTPITSAESRAKTIAARILASPQQYDVVCLQEVFDEDARKILVDELSATYPHYIRKSDGNGLHVVTSTAFGIAGVSALVPGGAALALVSGVVGLISLAFGPKFEDSGLMLFSKLRFETLAVQQSVRDAFAAQGVNLPAQLPATAFEEFKESSGEDAFAAKGVLYARLLREDGRRLHLLTAHTQADSTGGVGDHNGTRRKQLEQAFDLVFRMSPDIAGDEVLLCGDLNIDGTKHRDGYGQEWRDMFDAPGTHFTDQLLDAWTREQCPGDPDPPGNSRTPLPEDFDRGMTAGTQRLDYVLRGRGPSKDRLLLQHMCIAYDIATDPANPTAYTSDHLPLRVDLDRERPHASVLLAEEILVMVDGKRKPIPLGGDAVVSGILDAGQMHWYRITESGGYRFELTQGGPRVELDVYTADNLSVPVKPFTTLDDGPAQDRPGRLRFAVPTAPFFLRLSMPARLDREQYEVRLHRYGGIGPADAIPLRRGVKEPGQAILTKPHSLDDPGTPFSEHDAVWFVAPFDTEPDGSLHVTSTVTVSAESRAFGVLVLGRAPGGAFERMDERPAGGEVTARVAYDRPLTGYILVRREDPSFRAQTFNVMLQSDISYLYGAPGNPNSRARALATLFCRDETNGAFGSEWGSDDIQINVDVNGGTRLHIPNSNDLAFDDDTRRDLPKLDVVRYTGAAVFELVELDDLSPVDRASVSIPQFDALFGTDQMIAGNSAGALVKLSVIFDPADDEDDDDDGIYDLIVTVSPEPPGQP